MVEMHSVIQLTHGEVVEFAEPSASICTWCRRVYYQKSDGGISDGFAAQLPSKMYSLGPAGHGYLVFVGNCWRRGGLRRNMWITVLYWINFALTFVQLIVVAIRQFTHGALQ